MPDPLTATGPGASRTQPSADTLAARQKLLDKIKADPRAAAAFGALSPGHQAVVVGAVASIVRAASRGTTDLASTKASVLQLAGGADIWTAIG